MAANDSVTLPALTPEQRQAAVGQFERANQVIATGDYDYGIQLLLTCCRLDPGNLIYHQLLRRTEKAKYKNNLRGSRLAWLTTWPFKLRLKAAQRGHDHFKVLEHGEQVLTRNPWETGTLLVMAQAAEGLDLLELAVWYLEQARQKAPRDVALNRTLANLYEKSGDFTQAIALWEVLHRADSDDEEARRKVNELSARDTIARGNYVEAVVSSKPRGRRRVSSRKPEVKPKNEDDDGDTIVDGPASGTRLELDPVVVPLRTRIQHDPTDRQAYLELAAFYRRGGLLDEARQVLEQGVAPTGNCFELTMELADLQVEPFRRNLAVTEEKLKAEPNDDELKKIRARLLKEINTRELDLYRQRADRQPTEMSHRFELGLRLLRAGNVDEAIRELQTARDDMRLQWRSLLYLGHCFKARRNWKLARRNFEEALKALPVGENAARKEILFQLAQGCADNGELAPAIEMGMELANLDFTYRDINRLLDEWQAKK